MAQTVTDTESWLATEAVRLPTAEALLEGLVERLVAARWPIMEARLTIRTVSPLIAGDTHVWRRGSGGAGEIGRQVRFAGGSALDLGAFFGGADGPAAATDYADALEDRLRESGIDVPPLDPPGYEELRRLKAEGARVVVSVLLETGEAARHTLTLVLEAPPAHGDAAALTARLAPRVATPLAAILARTDMRTLLDTYLGRRTAGQVLAGRLGRRDALGLDAVLWASDVRGFTRLSERLERDRLLRLLNAHFERLAAPIRAFGGEILKFIGDGMLAMFPIDEADPASPAAAAGASLAAARSARSAVEALNRRSAAEGDPEMRFALALHRGYVSYGNVGAPDRLDFTLIGPAVNRVSRLLEAAKRLDRPVLISDAVSGLATEPLAPVGAVRLRDIDEAMEAFTLPELAER